MTRDRLIFLTHALDCADFIATQLSEIDREQFLNNRLVRDAILRNLEVIGQACKDYGLEQLEQTHPAIRWKRIAGFRNQLAHEYLGLDLELVWTIISVQIQPLHRALTEHIESQA